ncbi:MAG: hypothetical protein AAF713_15620 [Pseudomonadota bacterium]
MSAVAYFGLGLVLLGLGLLVRCIFRAQAIRSGELAAEEAQSAMRRLIWQHMLAVSTAFMGLGIMVVGMVL